MKINNETILRYLSGELSDSERIQFETEVEHLPEIKAIINRKKQILERMKKASGLSPDNQYFQNLTVRARERLAPKPVKRRIPAGIPISISTAIAVLILVVVFIPNNKQTVKIENEIAGLSDTSKSLLAEELSSGEEFYSENSISDEKVQEIINNQINETVDINNVTEYIAENPSILGTNELMEGLSDSEIDEIYNQMRDREIITAAQN